MSVAFQFSPRSPGTFRHPVVPGVATVMRLTCYAPDRCGQWCLSRAADLCSEFRGLVRHQRRYAAAEAIVQGDLCAADDARGCNAHRTPRRSLAFGYPRLRPLTNCAKRTSSIQRAPGLPDQVEVPPRPKCLPRAAACCQQRAGGFRCAVQFAVLQPKYL